MSQFTSALQKLYVAYFNRPADPVGLQFWDTQMQGGTASIDTISQAFAGSIEYQAAFAGMNNGQIVNQVYLNLFGRSAEAGGLAYWTEKLDNGSIHVNDVVKILADNAVSSDMDTVQAKIAAATQFTNGISGVDQLTAYSGTQANSLAKEFLSSIVAPAKTQINQADLDHFWDYFFLSSSNFPGHTQGAEVSLTTAADQLSTGANMDIIHALSIDGQESLGVLDVIDGGADIDMLSIASTLAQSYTFPSQAKISNVEILRMSTAADAHVDLSGHTGFRDVNLDAKGAVELTASTNSHVQLETKVSGTDSVVVNGGKNVAVTVTGGSTGTIEIGNTLAATGHTNLKVIGDTTGGAISVTGGTEISVVQALDVGNAFNKVNAAVTINGSAETSRVVSLATPPEFRIGIDLPLSEAINLSKVTINDVNAADASKEGTIHSAWLSGFKDLNFNGNGLDHLTLAHGLGDITIANAASTASHTSLNLVLTAFIGGVLDDADVYTTMNIKTHEASSVLANITDSALQNLNISGTQAFNLTSTTGMSALKSVKVAGAASLFSNFTTPGSLDVDTSASTGNSQMSFDRISLTYTGGTGADVIEVTNGAASITTGGGADEVKIGAPSLLSDNLVTILDPHQGLKLTFPDLGTEKLSVIEIGQLPGASKQDFLNAVAHEAGNAAENGVFGYFQFGGNTYVVETRHDASAPDGKFVHSVDMVVELVGHVDISNAHLEGNSLILG